MNSVEVVSAVTYIFFVALVLALFVERLMEILVAAFKYLEWRFKWEAFWNRLAEALAVRLEGIIRYQQTVAPWMAALVQQIFRRFLAEPAYPGEPWKIDAAQVRKYGIRAVVRMAAFAVSLILVLALKLDLVALVVHVLKLLYPIAGYLDFLTSSQAIHYLLTAAVISIGTEPLHTLIVRFERLNERARQKRQAVKS